MLDRFRVDAAGGYRSGSDLAEDPVVRVEHDEAMAPTGRKQGNERCSAKRLKEIPKLLGQHHRNLIKIVQDSQRWEKLCPD